MKNKTLIILCTVAALVLAAGCTLAIIYLPAIRKANHYSDGIDASFFIRYAAGDRPVYFVHGPVSCFEIDGKTTSFDPDGRLTPPGDLARLYDEKGRFDGFDIEGSEGKVTCTYDADNLLLSKMEDFDFSQGSFLFSYDKYGNLTEETATISEGDSLTVGITRRFIVLAEDAYRNWTLRRTPDGSIEKRTITYEEDPDGEKALLPSVSTLTYTMIRRKNAPEVLCALGARYLAMAQTFEKDREENLAKALPLLDESAAAGYADALYLTARCLETGVGKEKDPEQAKQRYEEAAEAGSIPAAILTADRYFNAKEYARALPFLEKAAEAGDALSSLRIADMYRNGWGVPVDQAEALLSYRTASADGNLLAMNRLGTCYENGRGCEVDSLSAFRAYQNAAFFGQMNAQYNLGECYRKGIGVGIDRYKARQWYTNAAAAGSASAKQALANMEKEDLELEAIDNPPEGEETEGPAIDYKAYFNF